MSRLLFWWGPLLTALAPLVIAMKKGRICRLENGCGDRLPVAELQFRRSCEHNFCASYVVSSAEEVSKFARAGTAKIAALFKTTSAATDLSLFKTPTEYFKTVSKETKGKYNRSANKARRLGYQARVIGRDAYALSLQKIRRSMPYRSRGAVYEAFHSAPVEYVDSMHPFDPPRCSEHWRIQWGLFHRDDPEMKAFASLQRSGNFVSIDEMIGHAEVLNLGGMKLLQFEVMQCLLAREEPWTKGISYLLHGGIEDGNLGLADWRRYVHQRPTLLRYTLPEDAQVPHDFDPAVYLRLHPDVKAARMDPRRHYIWHGILEGRAYKQGP
jgi:hypothetical protein